MALVGRTSRKGAQAHFPKTGQGGKAVKVSPGKGGHKLGTPTHCTSKRAHSNVKTSY